MSGLMLSDDLIFTSRVTGVAQSLGLEVASVKTPEALLERARQSPPDCVLVDLQNPGLDVAALVTSLKQGNKPNIVAYGSHVDTETLKKARAAGCDLVLPRSKFVADLQTDLPKWFKVGPRDI